MHYQEIAERFLKFSASVIRYCSSLHKNPIEKHISLQLVRSATSCGANYEESRGAESRSDFIHKIQLVLKELRESFYWIKLLKELEKGDSDKIVMLYSEAEELIKIISKSVVTAKKNKNVK